MPKKGSGNGIGVGEGTGVLDGVGATGTLCGASDKSLPGVGVFSNTCEGSGTRVAGSVVPGCVRGVPKAAGCDGLGSEQAVRYTPIILAQSNKNRIDRKERFVRLITECCLTGESATAMLVLRHFLGFGPFKELQNEVTFLFSQILFPLIYRIIEGHLTNFIFKLLRPIQLTEGCQGAQLFEGFGN